MKAWQMAKDTWTLHGGSLNTLSNGALTTLLVGVCAGYAWDKIRFISILIIIFYAISIFTKEE